MEHLQPIEVSDSGRPILHDGEVEVKIFSSIKILNTQNKIVISELLDIDISIITNYRVIFIIQSKHVKVNQINYSAWNLLLSNVSSLADCSTMFKRSNRISINLSSKKELGIRLSNHLDKEDYYKVFQDVLNKKSFSKINITSQLTSQQSNESANEPIFSATKAGVSGLLRKHELDMSKLESLPKKAFNDLDSLMHSAEEVVNIVKRYSIYLQDKQINKLSDKQSDKLSDKLSDYRERNVNDDYTETMSTTGEVNEIEEILQNIGLVSPVTRLTAGRLYYQQLARQVVDILTTNQRLEKLGGIITLPDLYCIVNKVRGTELLSPEDLFTSCNMISSFYSNILMKKFPSGVIVLQLVSNRNCDIVSYIQDLIDKDASFTNKGFSASELAISMHISIIIAKELLLEAERKGQLVRDDYITGLSFYINRFDELSNS